MSRRGIVLALLTPLAYGSDDAESCALLQTGRSGGLSGRELSVSAENATASGCAASGTENCLSSTCCVDPNTRCYKKNQYWAACLPKDTCTPGMIYAYDPPAYKTPWECADITGTKCPSDSSVSCLTAKCCTDPNYLCYQKNMYWAACLPKDTCKPGWINPNDPPAYQTPWACTDITDPTKCAADSSVSCQTSKCCADQSMRCYEKNQAWAACLPKDSCTPGMIYQYDPPAYQTPWSCKDITGIVAPTCPAGRVWMPGSYCGGTALNCECNYCDDFQQDTNCANACRVMNGYTVPPPGITSTWKAHANLSPQNVGTECDCSWMANKAGLGDDCKECTTCALKCREMNPFPIGTCR